jgi:hypothetical protein
MTMLTSDYRSRILKILEQSKIPIDVEYIRVHAGIGNWMSAKAILLELTIEGIIQAEKTSKSWIFRPQKKTVMERGPAKKLEDREVAK